jgi:hypothetical protein
MRSTHRQAALAVVATALLVLTAACSSDSKKSSGPTPTPLSTPQAQALASAAVLTAADMPGYKAEPETHDADDQASEDRVVTCLGLGKPSYLARNFGTSFSKGTLEVQSSADVAHSAAQARTELAALTGSKAEGCLKAEFAQLVSGSGGSITKFELTPIEVSVNGADDTFGYKLEFSASAAGQTLTFSGFDLGALVGQVEVDIQVFDSSGTPGLTTDQAEALLQKVTDRTKAAA